jgi:dipeptidyl aminopeptidase/acylaminoacyl peptidase
MSHPAGMPLEAEQHLRQDVSFSSEGLQLSGHLHIPDGLAAGQRRPGMLVLHGFGSNKNGGISKIAAEFFAQQGYVTLAFDMRGCGESEGERGKVIPLEQVQDTRNALDFLLQQPMVQTDRIGVMGFSFGAAVALYACAIEPRLACCISVGGWGDGEKKFKLQHASPDAWQRFSTMLEHGRAELSQGRSIRVPRFDIVPVRPEMRNNLSTGSILEFPFEVVDSMYRFRSIDVVHQIAPRPLLLLHPANDTVTPTEQSIDLFKRAGQPTELHLMAQVDHFMLGENNPVVRAVLKAWLDKYFTAP